MHSWAARPDRLQYPHLRKLSPYFWSLADWCGVKWVGLADLLMATSAWPYMRDVYHGIQQIGMGVDTPSVAPTALLICHHRYCLLSCICLFDYLLSPLRPLDVLPKWSAASVWFPPVPTFCAPSPCSLLSAVQQDSEPSPSSCQLSAFGEL